MDLQQKPGILYDKMSLRKTLTTAQHTASLVYEVADCEFISSTGVVDGQIQINYVTFLYE